VLLEKSPQDASGKPAGNMREPVYRSNRKRAPDRSGKPANPDVKGMPEMYNLPEAG
jgi:hypothetical protein